MIMQHEGNIKIYDGEDNLIDSKAYYSKEGRKKTMELWESDYDNGSYFLIFPFARIADATKEEKKRFFRFPIPPKVVLFVRPKAEYSNSKSLYK